MSWTCWTCGVLLRADKDWLERAIEWFTEQFPPYTFFNIYPNVIGLLAIILASLICGAVGSLVVGNRMAFFSDALAHCAFAGIALGFLAALLSGMLSQVEDFFTWAMPIMVGFGLLVGLAINYVREKTSLASDTVIGVFFAGAMGFGAMLLQGVSRLGRFFNPEDFLFGSPLTVGSRELMYLFGLGVLTAAVLAVLYNQLLFASFNPSLARSRRVPVRLCGYVLIALLALIINLCLLAVGALLINAFLIVPAATANNLSRNLRQMFWLTVGLSLTVGVTGHILAYAIRIPVEGSGRLTFGSGGTIVVLSVLLFFLSMFAGPLLRRCRPAVLPGGNGESASGLEKGG